MPVIPLFLFVTKAVHSGLEYTYIALIGIPLALPITADAPAVEPKSILPPLRYSRALLDPNERTHLIFILSFLNAFSNEPLSFIRRLTGL